MDFYIAKVAAYGPGQQASSVEFTSGLNVVCGASDTGKSAILKSIKYAFGGDDKPFSKESTGFDTIAVTIKTIKGEFTLTRKIGKGIINVVSNLKGIDSGDYDTAYKKENKRPVIDSILLKLLDIKGEPMIIKNQNGDRNHLTFNTILRSFYLNEDDIDDPRAVLTPSETTIIPRFLSSLLFLLIGDDFSNQNQIDSDAISKAKKAALEKFTHERVANFTSRRDELEEILKSYDGIDVVAEMQASLDRLTDAEAALDKAMAERSTIIEELSGLEQEAAQCELDLRRFTDLQTQLQADIDRISFISECSDIASSLPKKIKCPYCNNDMDDKAAHSVTKSASGELARTLSQLQGIELSASDLKGQLGTIHANMQEKEAKLKEIKELIYKTLAPKAAAIKEDINAFQRYLEAKNEYEVLHEVSEKLERALNVELEAKPVDVSKFKPKEHYPADFSVDMSKYAYDILAETKYRGLNTADFSLGKFDLIVNGETKADVHGKGYHSFINTVAGLTMRNYFIEHAKHKPGIFIVDTPLHGFEEGTGANDPNSMQYSLFQYFINHASDGQMIVVENRKNMPVIDFDSMGINAIEFTHGNYESTFKNNRYGFLIGVTGK